MQRTLLFLILHLLAIAPVAAVVLYDATLGTLPSSQSWLYLRNPNVGATISHSGATTNLKSTGSFGISGGIFTELPLFGILQHPMMPVLDKADGFEVRFSLQVLTEAHSMGRDDNNDGLLDRAGFSIITLSEDLAGIEVAFFENKIWVYEDGQTNIADQFTQAESVPFDTTVFTNYKLVGSPGGYALFANGVNILSGTWRTYAPSGVSTNVDPYDNPSFLFLGDNTGSASSNVLVGDISVVVGPFENAEISPTQVPIPIGVLAILFCSVLVRAVKKLPRDISSEQAF